MSRKGLGELLKFAESSQNILSFRRTLFKYLDSAASATSSNNIVGYVRVPNMSVSTLILELKTWWLSLLITDKPCVNQVSNTDYPNLC